MFSHNFKYTLKTLFRNRMLIFWTFAFPIILGTLFNLAFSNIEKSEKLDIIDIAVVANDEFNNDQIMKEAFEKLSDKNNEDRMFNTKYVSLKKARQLLEDKKIDGYLLIETEPKIIVSTNGINQTIFKYVVEEIIQTSAIIEKLSKDKIEKEVQNGNYFIDYEKIYQDVSKLIDESKANIKDISSKNLSYTMIEFYTLIAMTCLYGGIIGMFAINQNLANMSNNGKRLSITPISKGKMLFGSLLASYVIQLIGIFLLFIYTIFVLKVDYGDNLLLVVLLTLLGCLAGLSLGIVVSTLLKANDSIKTGIIIAITMLGSFLSGMMGITMKYFVDKNVPIINKLNPASMITDGFYSLYYYDTLNRYYFDVVSLIVFALLMMIISYVSLRRQKYDSI